MAEVPEPPAAPPEVEVPEATPEDAAVPRAAPAEVITAAASPSRARATAPGEERNCTVTLKPEALAKKVSFEEPETSQGRGSAARVPWPWQLEKPLSRPRPSGAPKG